MRAFLERECPGHGILGEEFGETPGDGRHRWVLDPIDGTKSFIHHVPLFGTLIALEASITLREFVGDKKNPLPPPAVQPKLPPAAAKAPAAKPDAAQPEKLAPSAK